MTLKFTTNGKLWASTNNSYTSTRASRYSESFELIRKQYTAKIKENELLKVTRAHTKVITNSVLSEGLYSGEKRIQLLRKRSLPNIQTVKKKCSNFTASARHDRSCDSQGTRDKGGGGKKHSPDKFSVLAYWSRTEKDENMAKRIWTNNCVSFLCAVSMTSTKHWNTGLGSRRQLWDKVFQKLTDDSTYTDFSNFHRINPSKEKLACSQVKMQPMTLLWNHSEERGDQIPSGQ